MGLSEIRTHGLRVAGMIKKWHKVHWATALYQLYSQWNVSQKQPFLIRCIYTLNRQLFIFILNLIFKTGPQNEDLLTLTHSLSFHFPFHRLYSISPSQSWDSLKLQWGLLLANFLVNDFSFSLSPRIQCLLETWWMGQSERMCVCVYGVFKGGWGCGPTDPSIQDL